jgi:NAD(P) transhydrogenase subunit alpha
MPEAWMKRQAALVAERAMQADIVITTALIPGRKPPVLLHTDTVSKMKPGSVVIDIAAGRGDNGSGNCPLTQADKVVNHHGVKIVGYTNLPSMVAADASALYARNLLDFMKLIINKEAQLAIPAAADDDIVAACLMCRDGQAIRTN